MDVVEKSESLSKTDREFLCGLLFHTINWFRERVLVRREKPLLRTHQQTALSWRRARRQRRPSRTIQTMRRFRGSV
ncbi:hypothetical protein J4Q44_G00082970 [Coregonus suidteri]|uniref:Uncharacterized protein n=1 Tax=Coregonus suidteri TaxID=861788 RepID=A0AAN8R1V3_9TELE